MSTKTLDLFEIVGNRVRFIVHVDSEARVIYTWDAGRVLQAWKESSRKTWSEPWDGKYEEIACQVHEGAPAGLDAARSAALAWAEKGDL